MSHKSGMAAGANLGGSGKGGGNLGLGIAGLGGFGQTATQAKMFGDAGEYSNTCLSVKEYAYAENRNQRFRPQMEDSKSFITSLITCL